jgi:ParB-like chromosome segregation protein Spo0J
MNTAQQIQIEQININDLKPDPANPRRISDQELEALTRSIREFGLVDPIIARREDKTVIGGHQRLIAARRLGYKTVPVVSLDLSQEQARLLNIALNKISGSFDQELLARLLNDLSQVPDVDLTLSGFGEDELRKLLKSLEAREKQDRLENFDLEEATKAAQAAPVAKRDDIWLLGEHKLACGDSTDREAVQRLMGGAKAGMTFTDPPYNVNYGDHRHNGAPERTIANDNLGGVFEPFLEKACRNILEFTDGAVYVCMSSSELHTLQKAFVSAGGHWSTFIIWTKNTFTIGRSDYQRQYEPIVALRQHLRAPAWQGLGHLRRRDARAHAPRKPDRRGAGQGQRRRQHVTQLRLILRRHHREVRDVAEVAQVEDAVVRRPVIAH